MVAPPRIARGRTGPCAAQLARYRGMFFTQDMEEDRLLRLLTDDDQRKKRHESIGAHPRR